jgi:triosephosphate isomerase (TIM)
MKTIIAGNWKMHKTVKEAVNFLKKLNKIMDKPSNVEIIICPSYTCLSDAVKESGEVDIGAQNIHFEKEGAFTGEISADMLKETGIKYVIIGHSERRQYYNETDETVNLKIKTALANNIKPIVCVGERLEQRKSNKTKEIISKQIKKGLEGIDVNKLIIAYEPCWAIGSGLTATKEQAEEVHSLIRSLINSDKVPILYGGSVKPENSKDLLSQPNINGALIGGASLNPTKFNQIIENAR